MLTSRPAHRISVSRLIEDRILFASYAIASQVSRNRITSSTFQAVFPKRLLRQLTLKQKTAAFVCVAGTGAGDPTTARRRYYACGINRCGVPRALEQACAPCS